MAIIKSFIKSFFLTDDRGMPLDMSPGIKASRVVTVERVSFNETFMNIKQSLDKSCGCGRES
jgi:hypothetical protein